MAESRYRRMWDHGDGTPPGALTWLQAWYASQCDGDWEHGYGIEIGTLDNPGWRVEIDIAGTALEARAKAKRESYRSEHDWCVTWVDGAKFHAACGSLNLGEAIHDFRCWVDDEPLAE